MPAGSALDRAILEGMEESCGVVFFITPSFVDEGYLESEINYAVREKPPLDRINCVARETSFRSLHSKVRNFKTGDSGWVVLSAIDYPCSQN